MSGLSVVYLGIVISCIVLAYSLYTLKNVLGNIPGTVFNTQNILLHTIAFTFVVIVVTVQYSVLTRDLIKKSI
jgi:hypothetical protein